MINFYVSACVVVCSLIGIAGAIWLLGVVVMKAINAWFGLFKLQPLLCDFFDWKAAEERRKARERLLSLTQNNESI